MNILKTLQYLKPDIKVVVWDNDIDKIQYHELETFRPTKDEILAVDQVLVAEFDKKINYASYRIAEYGSVEDQLDFIVKNGIDAFQKRNLAIKSKYPKP